MRFLGDLCVTRPRVLHASDGTYRHVHKLGRFASLRGIGEPPLISCIVACSQSPRILSHTLLRYILDASNEDRDVIFGAAGAWGLYLNSHWFCALGYGTIVMMEVSNSRDHEGVSS